MWYYPLFLISVRADLFVAHHSEKGLATAFLDQQPDPQGTPFNTNTGLLHPSLADSSNPPRQFSQATFEATFPPCVLYGA